MVNRTYGADKRTNLELHAARASKVKSEECGNKKISIRCIPNVASHYAHETYTAKMV